MDILADAPAELSEEFPGQMDADPPAEKAESEEMQAAGSKKYTSEDVYKMVSLVLRYPAGGHGGETFWTWMVKIYGSSLLEGRNGSGLRNRWRKISKEHPADLADYRRQLAESLPKDAVEAVDRRIEDAVADAAKLELSSKAFSSLFPELGRLELREGERLARKRRAEDNNGEGEERKKARKSVKVGIDLDTLVAKPGPEWSKIAEDFDVAGMEARITLGKDLVITKDLRTHAIAVNSITAGASLKELPTFKKPDVRQCDILRDANKGNTNIGQWSEIEDMVLKHPEDVDLNNCLIKVKGVEEVEKRKKILGII